ILFHFACRAPRAPRAKVPFPSALATCKAREGWHGLCMREGASLSRRKSIPGGALKPLTRGAANERANAERKLAHRQREADTKIRQSHRRRPPLCGRQGRRIDRAHSTGDRRDPGGNRNPAYEPGRFRQSVVPAK